MKNIKNWREASVVDIEADGLLDTITKMHIIGVQLYGRDDVTLINGGDHKRVKKFLQYHIDKEIPLVGHNFISYDVPAMQMVLGMDLSELMVIDTLALSWYLNINHRRHSIEALSGDYPEAAAKFQVDEGGWVDLSWEDAVKRVTTDVEINVIIWKDFMVRLEDMYSIAKEVIDNGEVGGKRVSPDEVIYLDSLLGLDVDDHVGRILSYLMFKKDCQALQEATKWDVDVPYLEKNIKELQVLVDKAAEGLEVVMPQVAVYVERKEPTRKFLKAGGLSVSGERWASLIKRFKDGNRDELGNLEVEVRKAGSFHEIKGYNKPNINSHQQVKDFLFSHGWIPATYNYARDKDAFTAWINSKPEKGAAHWEWTVWKDARPEDRAIPQVRLDGEEGKELCPSVSELAAESPEIWHLEEYSVIKHRYDTLLGILNRLDENNRVEASFQGFTNTLRVKHRAPCVNLPAADKKYALPIRGSLVALVGKILAGADLSSLEDRVKIMFMMPHDPEYAEEMSKDSFCPHLSTAVAMGEISVDDMITYISKTLGEHERARVASKRNDAKPVNYLSVYGGSFKALMLQTGWDEQRCKDAIEAYWEKNWSVKAIAAEQVVVTCGKGFDWLVNPINGLLYSVRSEKDYFSTLAQGTGAFFVDMWFDKILEKQLEIWGFKFMTAQFHDEGVWLLDDDEEKKGIMEKIIRDSIKEVSDEYLVRRDLDVDVQFGERYSDIH